ncbi:GTF3C5 [Symbiodinium natans]|uniref:GTF3C5 protein n=1 Tax=Symbiodinium natans TaxID=878477 RepID=A0A812N2B4_9DINO|nr:GTF3C5 [Symbiodinium natans]
MLRHAQRAQEQRPLKRHGHHGRLRLGGADPRNSTRLILDGAKQLNCDTPRAEGEMGCNIFELEMRGIKHAEAIRVLVDFLYGSPTWTQHPVSQEVCTSCTLLQSSACRSFRETANSEGVVGTKEGKDGRSPAHLMPISSLEARKQENAKPARQAVKPSPQN